MNKSAKNIISATTVLLLGLGFHATSSADDFYIGAGAYTSETTVNGANDDDSTSGFLLGYTFVDSFVILSTELAQYDLGSYTANGNNIESDATTLSLVASVALGPFFEIYAKAGVAAVDLEINGQVSDGDESFTGIGFGFDILDTIDIFVEVLEFDTDANSEMIGLGIRLDF